MPSATWRTSRRPTAERPDPPHGGTIRSAREPATPAPHLGNEKTHSGPTGPLGHRGRDDGRVRHRGGLIRVKRRTLLRTGGGLAATSVAWATGCDNDRRIEGGVLAVRHGRATGTARRDAGTATPAAGAAAAKRPNRDWTALGKSLHGAWCGPGDAAYATARRLYNTRFDDLRPAALAYVSAPADIADLPGLRPPPRHPGRHPQRRPLLRRLVQRQRPADHRRLPALHGRRALRTAPPDRRRRQAHRRLRHARHARRHGPGRLLPHRRRSPASPSAAATAWSPAPTA